MKNLMSKIALMTVVVAVDLNCGPILDGVFETTHNALDNTRDLTVSTVHSVIPGRSRIDYNNPEERTGFKRRLDRDFEYAE